MQHVIYKITNNINNRYYIGRHSTSDLNDGYMGSGKGIINAIRKYGLENFTKEILIECGTSAELWDVEREIINDEVVRDPKSYNMAYGGKHYLDGLRKHDPIGFKKHQSEAGKKGGPACYAAKSTNQKQNWHSSGGKACAAKQKKLKTHPFYTGEAASKGGKAITGYTELWSPSSVATNKNQIHYRPGDCKRVRLGSEKYTNLIAEGWLPISAHKSQAW